MQYSRFRRSLVILSLVFGVQLLFNTQATAQTATTDVNLSSITSESILVPVNTTPLMPPRDETGSLYSAPNVGYNTVNALFNLDSGSPVNDGQFLSLGALDTISINLRYANPNPTTGGAFIIRLWTANWIGSSYVPTGNRHSHEFSDWQNDDQWHTYSVGISDFTDPISDLSELSNVYSYSVDAVQWDAVDTPYRIGIGSIAAVPEPSTLIPISLAVLAGGLRRKRKRIG